MSLPGGVSAPGPSAAPAAAGKPPRRAAFLDRDGVLTELVWDASDAQLEGPFRAADLELAPGAARAIADLQRAGYLAVLISNQPAAAKGKTTREGLAEAHERFAVLLAAQGVALDAIRYCLHHPASADAELGIACSCRKPAPGSLLAVASELDLDLAASWMIGDSDSDIEAGRAAGCRTLLVENPGSAHRRGRSIPDARAVDITAATAHIIRTGAGS